MNLHAEIKLKSGEKIAEYYTVVSGDHACEIHLVREDTVERIHEAESRGPSKQKIREDVTDFLESIDHDHAGADLLIIRQ